jgi:hypothetical protein
VSLSAAILPLLLFGLPGLPAQAGKPGGGFEEQLERLGSASSAERRGAERWIAAHIAATDFALAAGAARDGDAEMRRRLSWALAADSRNLGLAVLFLADPDGDVSEVGRVAVLEMIDRWNPSAEELPLAPSVVPADWEDSASSLLSIDLRDAGIATLVDRIERLAPAPATLVLDPGLDPGVHVGAFVPLRSGGAFEGVWSELLPELARVQRVAFEVHGQRAYASGGQPWVRIHASGGGLAFGPAASTADLCIEWCRGVLRTSDPAWSIACARALASLGWPAAIAWFEQLWDDRGDVAAREALLLAASRGRVAPSFSTPADMEGLLESVDRELSVGAPGSLARAQRLALAMGAMGQLGADARWSTLLTRGWKGLPPAARWLRLVALEGQARAGAGVRQLALAEFGRSGSTGLRLQALRTAASLRGDDGVPDPALQVRAPAQLFERGGEWLDELTLHLSAAEIPFPAGDWHASLHAPGQLLAVLSWRLDSGDGPQAVQLFWRILESGSLDLLAERLRLWCGMARNASVEALLEQAAIGAVDAGARAQVERVRLRAGLLPEEARRVSLDRLLERSTLNAQELLDLGALCAAPDVGWRARAALVEEVANMPPAADLAPAVAQALVGLGRVRLDREAEVLASRLRTAAQSADHPILELLYQAGWPPRSSPRPLALDRMDRRLGFSGR